MNRFFVVALMATCFAANAALETIPLTTNESGRVGWEIGLARSNINAMVELIPELDSKIGSTSNAMAAAIALKQDALPQAGHGELLYSLFGFPAWLGGASSYAIMMHNGTTVNWLDKPAGETGSGLLAFGQTNGLHWTGNGYPYSFNGEVAARMKIPASDLSTDYEDGFYGLTVQNGEISFGEIQDPGTITNDWSEVIAAIPVGDPNALSGRFAVTSTAPLTLVVSNGLVYAVLPNGDMVDVTYYLPAFAVAEPTTNYPAGFAEFGFTPNTTNVSASAPKIAEWTRQNQPGDTMALTAENLDQTNALFVFFDGSDVLAGDILVLDDRQCAVTLPDGLTSNAFYLMWPYNSGGFGEPVGINQTELWWIGFDVLSAGDVFYAYGQSLMLGGGDCSLYIAELDRWLTSEGGNQYKAQFTLPSDVTNGTYTVYAHNGHGGKYGWSEAKTITVNTKITWSATTVSVATYGADGSDELDDLAAFNSAITAAGNYGTIEVPAGIFYLSDSFYIGNRRLVGAGMDETIISSFAITDTGPSPRMINIGNNCAVSNMTFRPIYESCDRDFVGVTGTRVKLQNVRVSMLEENGNTGTPLDFSYGEYIHAVGCEVISGISTVIMSTYQVRMEDCSFIGIEDGNQLVSLTANRIDISGCSVKNYDETDMRGGFGWCKGRWIVAVGRSYDCYLAENTTSNLLPRSSEAFLVLGTPTNISARVQNVPPFNTDRGYQVFYYSEDIPDELEGWGGVRTNSEGRIYHTGKLYLTSDDPSWPYAYDPDKEVNIQWFDAINNTISIEINMLANPYTSGYDFYSGLADVIDQNSGEQFLFEGAGTYFVGSPTNVSSLVMTFEDPYSKLSQIGAGYVAQIVGGKGVGQYRRITAVSSAQKTVTIGIPWKVAPDSTSTIRVGRYSDNIVFLGNIFDGRPSASNPDVYTASAGVQVYGGAANVIIDGNTFSELRRGVALIAFAGSNYRSGTETTLTQSFFDYIYGNSFTNCMTSIGISESSSNISLPMTDDNAASMANVVRNNTSISNTYSFYTYGGIGSVPNPYSKMNVFHENWISGATNALIESGYLEKQIWIGNTFSGAGGTLYQISSGHYPAFVGNSYSGFTTNYNSSYSALQIPQGTVLLSDASKTIQLLNVGTTGLAYTATDNAAWLSVTDSGAIGAASSADFVLAKSGSTTNGATALVSVVASGQTNVFTVIYGDELGVE